MTVRGTLAVAFLPDYNVSLAEAIIPAAELSQQISTAGMEASGTGNMKLALNGALTIGTLDGANIEILDAVGEENIFIFGLTAEQVAEQRASGYRPAQTVAANPELEQVLTMIHDGEFHPESPEESRPLVDALLAEGEHFLVLADYADYVAAQDAVDALYRDPAEWTRRAIINTARVGYFSSDRAIREYAADIWGVQPLAVVPGSERGFLTPAP